MDDEDWEDWDRYDEDDPDDTDEWVLDCGNPDCVMNYQPHFRGECYTPEDYEAMVAESSTRTADSNRG